MSHSTPPTTSPPATFTSPNPTFLTQVANLSKFTAQNRSNLPLSTFLPLSRNSAHAPPLSLLKLQIFIRHGPRTFLSSLPNYEKVHYGSSNHADYSWFCPPFTRESLQEHHFRNPTPPKNLSFDLYYEQHENIIKGNCGAGQLTMIGWNYMERVGALLRERYGYLLRDTMQDSETEMPQYDTDSGASSDIYIRTTDSHPRRTEDSTKAILMGWMPEVASWRIYRVEPRREYFYNRESHCPRLGVLYRQFRHSQDVEDEKKRLERDVEPRLRETLQMTATQRMPSLRTLYNTIDCIRTDLKPLNLSEDEIEDVHEHALWYYGKRYASENRLVGRLAVSRVFDLIVQNIDARIQKDLNENGGQRKTPFTPFISSNIHSTPKQASVEIYVCHDQTLLPMLSLLYQRLRRFPGFGSWVAYETFKGLDDNEYYIRVVWDGEPLNLSRDGHTGKATPLQPVTKYDGVAHLYKYEDFKEWCLEEVCFDSYRDACAPVPGEVVFPGVVKAQRAEQQEKV